MRLIEQFKDEDEYWDVDNKVIPPMQTMKHIATVLIERFEVDDKVLELRRKHEEFRRFRVAYIRNFRRVLDACRKRM